MDLLPAVRGVHLAATLLLAGASAFELLVLRAVADDVSPANRVRGWLRLACVVALGAAAASWVAWLALLAISMSGLPVDQALTSNVLRTVIESTTFGHVWSVRMALFLFVAVLLGSVRRRASNPALGPAICLAAAAALVGSLAWTGHAMGVHALHLLVDIVHLLAAALWLGMLVPLWLIIRRAASSEAWHHLAVSAADLFFWPGAIAVLALAASGAANMVWLVGSVDALVATRYGLLVVAKVVLFAAMVLAATINRSLTRRLRAARSLDEARLGVRALRASVTVELLCGVMAIAVVALLGVSAPPSHEHAMHHMQGM